MNQTGEEKIFSEIKLTLEVKLIRLWNHFNRWVFREIGTHLFYLNLSKAASCLGLRGVVTPSADSYNNRGSTRDDLSDKKAAIDDYDQAIKLKPDSVAAYSNRGLSRSDLGNNEAAIADFDQAIRLKPNDADAYFKRGNVRNNLGDNRAAIADYDQAVKRKPDYTDAYFNRGNALSALSGEQSAILDYQKVAELRQIQDKIQNHQNTLNQIKELQQCPTALTELFDTIDRPYDSACNQSSKS